MIFAIIEQSSTFGLVNALKTKLKHVNLFFKSAHLKLFIEHCVFNILATPICMGGQYIQKQFNITQAYTTIP